MSKYASGPYNMTLAHRVAGILLFLIFIGQEAESQRYINATVNGEGIMEAALTRARENEKSKIRNLEYKAVHIEERKLDNGQVIEEVNETLLLIGENDRMNKILLRRNGAPAGENEKSSGLYINMIDILATRYTFELAQEAPLQIEGKPYYLIEFRPKPGLKNTSKADHVVNRAFGKIFVNASDFFIWKVEVWLPDDFTIGMYFFKMYTANLVFEQQEIYGMDVEKLLTINARYRNGWLASVRNLSETYTFFDFKLRDR